MNTFGRCLVAASLVALFGLAGAIGCTPSDDCKCRKCRCRTTPEQRRIDAKHVFQSTDDDRVRLHGFVSTDRGLVGRTNYLAAVDRQQYGRYGVGASYRGAWAPVELSQGASTGATETCPAGNSLPSSVNAGKRVCWKCRKVAVGDELHTEWLSQADVGQPQDGATAVPVGFLCQTCWQSTSNDEKLALLDQWLAAYGTERRWRFNIREAFRARIGDLK